MERGRDETKGKEPMTKREELGASSTNMIKQLGIYGEQLGISGDFSQYQVTCKLQMFIYLKFSIML